MLFACVLRDNRTTFGSEEADVILRLTFGSAVEALAAATAIIGLDKAGLSDQGNEPWWKVTVDSCDSAGNVVTLMTHRF